MDEEIDNEIVPLKFALASERRKYKHVLKKV